MRQFGGLAITAVIALCILGAAACGDDSKEPTPDAAADGGPRLPLDDAGHPLGVDMDGAVLGRPDGSTLITDGAIIAADGAITEQIKVDSGVSSGPDAAVGPCPGGCNDNIDCTIDRCINNACTHAVDNSVCKGAASCTLDKGCQTSTKTCANNTDCADMDGCTTNERCDGALKVCKTDVLDGDFDGYPPISCRGADCNDDNGLINPDAKEMCNGVDDNCNGQVDDGATCLDPHAVCSMGNCNTCAAGFTKCNGVCVDLQTDPLHCGACNPDMTHMDVTCGSAGICTAGACSCTPPATVCGADCVDTKTSQANCGGCTNRCMATGTIMAPQQHSCFNSACEPCGNDGQACCTPELANTDPRIANQDGCYGALTCHGTQGAADAKCACAAGATMCQGVCTDLRTDSQNCGACGNACQGLFQFCQAKGETATCVSCGNAGEPCCDIGTGVGTCRSGTLVCGSDNTCVKRPTATPGG